MNETELETLKSQLNAAKAKLSDSSRSRTQRLPNMRMFAGNDSRVLNRIPLVRQVAIAEQAAASALEEALASVQYVEEALSKLR